VPEVVGLRDAVDGILNTVGIDEKSISLGLRWDCYKNIALKAQWSHIWLGGDGTQLWVPTGDGEVPHRLNVFSFGIDFLF
jgi:hypothetical protein